MLVGILARKSESTQVRIIMIKMAGGYWEGSYRVSKLAVDQRRRFSLNDPVQYVHTNLVFLALQLIPITKNGHLIICL